MTNINPELAESLLSNFGISVDDVEIVSEKRYEITNGISDGEIDSLAGPYGKAILERMKDTAFFFNANLVASQITLPWRELLDAFRDDLEQTSSLQSLILPDGSEQKVLVDSGKYPGDPQLRKALWHLHEILEEIENYQPSDHINPTLRSGVMSQIRRETNPANHRGATYPVDEILEEAKRLGYWSREGAVHGGKKAIRNKIVQRLNLQKHNKATSPRSMDSNIERILRKSKHII